jgi:hypothetical protein
MTGAVNGDIINIVDSTFSNTSFAIEKSVKLSCQNPGTILNLTKKNTDFKNS